MKLSLMHFIKSSILYGGVLYFLLTIYMYIEYSHFHVERKEA